MRLMLLVVVLLPLLACAAAWAAPPGLVSVPTTSPPGHAVAAISAATCGLVASPPISATAPTTTPTLAAARAPDGNVAITAAVTRTTFSALVAVPRRDFDAHCTATVPANATGGFFQIVDTESTNTGAALVHLDGNAATNGTSGNHYSSLAGDNTVARTLTS